MTSPTIATGDLAAQAVADVATALGVAVERPFPRDALAARAALMSKALSLVLGVSRNGRDFEPNWGAKA